jgi:diguanylate cyclase (GGDEF)-like protein
MDLQVQERRRRWLVAGITLAYLVLCTSVQALPALFPVWLVTLLGNGYAVQVVRWFMVGVVAVALVRQWETVLRVPLAFLLAAVFLSALAAVLFSLSETSAAVSSLLVFVQKPVIVLGYLCMVGTVITLPRRTNTTRDHSLIFIDSLQFVVAGLLLIWLYFILPGGDDSIRGVRARSVLDWLKMDAAPLFDVALLLVMLFMPRTSKTGALRNFWGGIATGLALILVGDLIVMLTDQAPSAGTDLAASLFQRSSIAAFLYAGLSALPPLADWTEARPAPVEQRLRVVSSLLVVVLLAALFFEQVDHGSFHALMLSAGATFSGLLLLLRQVVLQRRRNVWTVKQRQELERQVAERTAELSAARARLELLASEDPLTLLPNRRVFDEALNTAWSACARAGQPLSLALLDIDLFKAYNDHYGHPAGDACLQHVANILKRVVRRRTDLVARYGGEEFLLLLPQTDAAGAELFAERVRAAIEEAALPHAASTVAKHITVSVGVVTVQPDAVSLPERLFFAADAALYEAKAEGRNCVRVGKA